jgi:hypothetical protein
MTERPARTYADSSVFGGVFDQEFAEASSAFFEEVRQGRHILVSSGLVEAELEAAPLEVRRLLTGLESVVEMADTTPEAIMLQQAYLAEGIVPARCASDAMHVAIATVAGCRTIVSWNFRHIVHGLKIPLYNAVNTLKGYPGIAIFSPKEVIRYEEEL